MYPLDLDIEEKSIKVVWSSVNAILVQSEAFAAAGNINRIANKKFMRMILNMSTFFSHDPADNDAFGPFAQLPVILSLVSVI